MKKLTAVCLAALLLAAWAVPVWAGPKPEADRNDGVGAYYEEDYARAFKEFWALAEQGDAGGQFGLGVLYGNGKGVPLDYVQAYMWLNLAADQGHKDAGNFRDVLAKKMTPAQIAEAKRLARDWRLGK